MRIRTHIAMLEMLSRVCFFLSSRKFVVSEVNMYFSQRPYGGFTFTIYY